MNRQQTTRHLIERAQDAAESELYTSDLTAELADHVSELQAMQDAASEVATRWEDGELTGEEAMQVLREVMRERDAEDQF